MSIIGVVLASAAPANGLTLQPIAEEGTFEDPTYVTSDPSNANRLFVTEQTGELKLVEGGAVSTVVDLEALGLLCDPCGFEEGLLSVALAPDFPTSGRLYVDYTDNSGNVDQHNIQIDEFTLGAGDPTRREVLEITHPNAANHNGGQLQFGPDGFLYISTGDGGDQGDPEQDAQSLDSLLGKVLRIDPSESESEQYTSPGSNPFIDVGRDEIWSYGLRNPWRFSFDALTGDLLIGDVGAGTWEEVDYDPAPNPGRGLNFGWDCREGPDPTSEVGGGHCDPPFVEPIFFYPRVPGGAITGGYVVRDAGLGDLFGRYLYADYADGEIRSLVPGLPSASGDRSEGVGVGQLSSFGQDAACRIYVASRETDTVYRLVGDQASGCATVPGGDGGAGERCLGEDATIVASRGVDIIGTGRRDVIVGSSAGDEIRTRAGRDLVCARGGKDDIRTGGGKDSAKGGGGADELRGGGKKDDLRGGRGKDDLRGARGKDDLRGGGGKDRLKGGPGKDDLRGSGGKDRLKGGPGKDRLRGGGGNDRCNGGGGRDREQSC